MAPAMDRVRKSSLSLRVWLGLLSNLACSLCIGRASAAGPTSLSLAEKMLAEGRADAAVGTLQPILAANRSDGPAHLLLCRVWVAEEQFAEAGSECKAALANGLAGSAAAQDWTGRALGRQAEHAGPIAGLKLALGVKTAFETAVQLDPNSEAATVDLGEYYTVAPAIVGGGTGKALSLADRTQRSLPAVAHRIRAMVAEKNKDLASAEIEFQAEVAVAHAPGALADLAAFYQRHNNREKAIATARQILLTDRAFDAAVVEAATILDGEGQTGLAEEALRGYLSHGHLSDAQPAFRVHTLLGSLLARAGQKAAARAEFEQALALASHYAPAQKGLGAL